MTLLVPHKVKAGLRTEIIGQTIHCFRELPSTNDMAKLLAAIGAREGTVIVADSQTRGRGRRGREWVSPVGGLWVSIITKPRISGKDAPKLTLMMSLVVAKTLNKLFNLETEIKWPNDVLVQGRKVCGILTETSIEVTTLNFAVIGVGINANFSLNDLPANLRDTTTSLREELRMEIDRESLLRALLEETERYYGMFTGGEQGAILAEWRRLSKFLGSYIEVLGAEEKLEGWAVDIDDDGALIVKLKDRTTRKIISGDVIVRKME